MSTLEIRGKLADFAEQLATGTVPQEVVFSGPAGTGKTYAILLILHLLSLEHPNLRILIARKTRNALTESVLVTYEKEVLPVTGHQGIAEGVMRRVRQSYVYPNGTEWIVGGLDNDTKILSTSYDIGFVNECIELDLIDWETLTGRIGRPGRSHNRNILIGDTNPGDSGHWIKKREKEGDLPIWTTTHRDNPGLWDLEKNDWTEAGARYIGRLQRMTGSRRKRMLEGQWVTTEGAWFDTFGPQHISENAEYNHIYPTYLAVDNGVHTGALWFQIVPRGLEKIVHVFGDYYSVRIPAYQCAKEILKVSHERCQHMIDEAWTDPAGGAHNAIGPTLLSEYERAGLRLRKWPKPDVLDGLMFIESLISITPPRIYIHPRCVHTIDALNNYQRKQHNGQFIDEPVDPQHPYEEMIDTLRCGLMVTLANRRPRSAKVAKTARKAVEGYRVR